MALNNTVLKELRKEKKLTQTELASKLNISQKSYSNWESGKSEPTLDNIIKLANILNTTTDKLLGINKSVTSNWTSGIKTTITQILNIPKNSQLQKRIEEELEFEWNEYKKKYPDMPIYSMVDWIPYNQLEIKSYDEILNNKNKRDILKKSLLCVYLHKENIFDAHSYLIKKWKLSEQDIKHLNTIFLEVEEYIHLH